MRLPPPKFQSRERKTVAVVSPAVEGCLCHVLQPFTHTRVLRTHAGAYTLPPNTSHLALQKTSLDRSNAALHANATQQIDRFTDMKSSARCQS